MKKNILSVAFALAMSLGANAAPINGSQASRIANMFINGRSAMYATTEMRMVTQSSEVMPYYVFNIGDNEGFVIVAGDDAVNPILAYSYKGSFKIEDMPDNVKSVMTFYRDAITEIQKLNMPAKAMVHKADENREPVMPMLKSKWNQNAPFNNDCPDFGNGKCYAGCVPVAMSQIMNYHQWPAYEIGKIPGYKFYEYSMYGDSNKERTLEALPPTTFNWKDAAKEKIGNPKFDEAVAEICRYAGQACRAAYGKNATGANTAEMLHGMMQYLDYSAGVSFISHNNFKNEEMWRDIIYDELSKGRPLILEGSPEDGPGHEFICDGYENGKYHINWGWGGAYDGYFDLDSLNPDDYGIGGTEGNYSYNYGIVLNAEPAAHNYFVYAERMTVTPGSVYSLQLKFDCDSKHYTSVQFDLTLPEGISMVNGADGMPDLKLNTTDDHTVSCNRLTNGDYRFIISSPSNSVFVLNEKNLLSFDITIDANAVINNDVNIVTKNGIVCNTMYKGFDFNPYNIILNLPEDEMIGDANGDGVVDEDDVEKIRIAVMEGKGADINVCDMNKDGVIDIADFMLVMDKVRRKNGQPTYFEPTVKDGLIVMGDIKNPVNKSDKLAYFFPTLANAPAAKAVQFNLKIANSARIEDIFSDPASRTANKDFWNYYKYIGNNTYRIIVYDTQGRNIEDHFYAISGIGVENFGDLETEYSDIVLFTTDFRKLSVKSNGYDPNGIDNVVVENESENGGVYTIEGVKVSNDTDKLPDGIYIVNGKKMVIK